MVESPVAPVDAAAREAIESSLGHRFQMPDLLTQALVHSSARAETGWTNERMEFLGDAVAGLVVSEFLFREYPDLEEGDMSAIKSVVVSAPVFAGVARSLGLESHVRVGKGIVSRGAIPESVLGNAFEALLAAVYLDGGLEEARQVALTLLRPKILEVREDRHEKNYKSLLQQRAQREWAELPDYRVVGETGPHHEKTFEAVVCLRGTEYGTGRGRSKKDAEQQAAKQALQALHVAENGPPDPPAGGPSGPAGTGAGGSSPAAAPP